MRVVVAPDEEQTVDGEAFGFAADGEGLNGGRMKEV
jgi:hypothetical protein